PRSFLVLSGDAARTAATPRCRGGVSRRAHQRAVAPRPVPGAVGASGRAYGLFPPQARCFHRGDVAADERRVSGVATGDRERPDADGGRACRVGLLACPPATFPDVRIL